MTLILNIFWKAGLVISIHWIHQFLFSAGFTSNSNWTTPVSPHQTSGQLLANTTNLDRLVKFYTYVNQQCTQLIDKTTFFSLPSIGSLHDPVTWYNITHAGEQVAQWDFQNNATRTSPPGPAFFSTAHLAHQYVWFCTKWPDCANGLFDFKVTVV